MANPILKWAGGKRQIINDVLRHFPKDYKSRPFHEPMFGAGAITFSIEPRSGSINDINRRLINLYLVVRDRPDELIEHNKKHIFSKEYFYQARERFNLPINGGELDPLEEASLLIFLNRTCFNGLYRENSKGGFNVPFGSYKKVDFIQEENIRKASQVLRHLDIHNEDYNYVLKTARPGDLVYFDPPYHPVSETSSFTSYSKFDFGYDEQVRLKETLAKLDKKKVMVVLSNSSATDMKELYGELESFKMSEIKANRAINCNGSKRGEVGEVIVTNVPEDAMLVRF